VGGGGGGLGGGGGWGGGYMFAICIHAERGYEKESESVCACVRERQAGK